MATISFNEVQRSRRWRQQSIPQESPGINKFPWISIGPGAGTGGTGGSTPLAPAYPLHEIPRTSGLLFATAVAETVERLPFTIMANSIRPGVAGADRNPASWRAPGGMPMRVNAYGIGSAQSGGQSAMLRFIFAWFSDVATGGPKTSRTISQMRLLRD